MLALLPFLGLAVCTVVVATCRPKPLDPRDPLLIACVIVGAWFVAGAEILSIFGALGRVQLALWWGVPTAALGAAAFLRRDRIRGVTLRAPLRAGHLLLLGACAAILLITCLLAALLPPNIWDAFTYHLPRQVYWQQNGSVWHYPAVDLRQLMMPPLAEFIGVHHMILSGGGAWDNMAQWFAFAAAAVAASAIARDLRAPAGGQLLAALLVVTLPIALAQAANAKNDVVTAMWTMVAAWLAARPWAGHRATAGGALLTGLALGLLALSKGTGMLFAVPIGAVYGVGVLAQRPRLAPAFGVITAAAALAIVGGHFARNQALFGSPIGPGSKAEGGYGLTNETFTPAAIASNVVRNAALHLAWPDEAVNDRIESGIVVLHEWIGADINDPRTTQLAEHPFRVWAAWSGDATAAPVHALLSLVVAAGLLLRPRLTASNPAARAYAALPFAAFLLFCIALKWQPWHSRLHVPIFCLLAPAAGWMLTAGHRLAVPVRIGAVAATLVFAGAALLTGERRGLTGERGVLVAEPNDVLFRDRPDLRGATEEVVALAARLGPGVVALHLGPNQWEYPLQRLLLDTMDPPPLITEFAPRYGAALAGTRPVPDVVIANRYVNARLIHPPSGAEFIPVAQFNPYTIYITPAMRDRFESDLPPVDGMPFIGWSGSEGLDRAQGPYPQWDLPVVRWGTAPRTRLIFEGDGRAMELILEGRRNDSREQEMVVVLNGAELARYPLGHTFLFIRERLALPARPGQNELVIEYAVGQPEATPRDRAVLFKRLQILPAGAG